MSRLGSALAVQPGGGGPAADLGRLPTRESTRCLTPWRDSVSPWVSCGWLGCASSAALVGPPSLDVRRVQDYSALGRFQARQLHVETTKNCVREDVGVALVIGLTGTEEAALVSGLMEGYVRASTAARLTSRWEEPVSMRRSARSN